ncbi:RagB/SusD family nutrient uptake outer membrane protein [Cellulophaga sp. HaHaR_3_176]|uniref:RagB/SusD family nutrient uptake outer membrane protein n=1 Tax=Cellulophaga sp. HaHaR_3_176 TaxID=1942464 RepID=UPI001C1F2BCB|nr:RagB/SusD family nutrient uptake outer membrane protein [Cellulophaga sp. HaHaR_3_176]QWX84010.1 RagB/SusD family nutrient uptake outer membrane protein [Cellulophaga sp. HaHaR_3_176]
MKTYKYLFLLIGLSIVGCSDLEEEPVGLLAPDGFFKTTNDIQTAVDGALTHSINEQFWGRKLSIALMLRSDLVSLASNETRRVEHNEFTTLASNGMISEFWPRTYQGIAAANQAIAGAEDVEVSDDIKNPVTAQAYFARAFYYFHLVRLFGDVPYIDEPITDVDAATSISRTPAAEVYANIIEDLKFAKAWLPNTTASRAIPSKGAASSYLSLVYLTMGDWENAFNESEEVITNSGIYNLGLDPNFQNLFNANEIDASIEPIFSIDYNNFEAEDNAYDQVAPMTGIRGDDRNLGGGWSVAVPTLAVYTTWDAGDYRRAVSMDDEASIGGVIVDFTQFDISGHEFAKNNPYVAKYMRFPGAFARANARATSHNYSMIRYAEVLLIAAEAAVELGDNASALKYVNQVRERARMGGLTQTGAGVEVEVAPGAVPADLTGTVTVNDILEERKYEFAFEGIRWYDIARRKIGDQVFSASGLEGAKPFFNADDYLLPLPEDELERNPNLTQNPGY